MEYLSYFEIIMRTFYRALIYFLNIFSRMTDHQNHQFIDFAHTRVFTYVGTLLALCKMFYHSKTTNQMSNAEFSKDKKI